MTDFVSQVKSIASPREAVFDTLSDLSHLERVEGLIPSDKVSDLNYDRDTVSFKVNMAGVGQIRLRVVERDPHKTIKLETEQSPVPFTFWIQLKEKDPSSSYLKLTLRADLPFLLQGMLAKPLQDGLEKLADGLAAWSY